MARAYGGFEEGFDTRDLREAAAFLEIALEHLDEAPPGEKAELLQRLGFEQLTARDDYYGPGRHALILRLWDLPSWIPPDPAGTETESAR